MTESERKRFTPFAEEVKWVEAILAKQTSQKKIKIQKLLNRQWLLVEQNSNVKEMEKSWQDLSLSHLMARLFQTLQQNASPRFYTGKIL